MGLSSENSYLDFFLKNKLISLYEWLKGMELQHKEEKKKNKYIGKLI